MWVQRCENALLRLEMHCVDRCQRLDCGTRVRNCDLRSLPQRMAHSRLPSVTSFPTHARVAESRPPVVRSFSMLHRITSEALGPTAEHYWDPSTDFRFELIGSIPEELGHPPAKSWLVQAIIVSSESVGQSCVQISLTDLIAIVNWIWTQPLQYVHDTRVWRNP